MTAGGWVVALAQGDCEAISGGLLGQPANTVSSLAFVVAGVWLMSRAHRPRGWRWATLGLAAVAAGIGSVAYHGPMPAAGQLLHDLGLVSMPLTVGAIEIGTRRRGPVSMLWVLLPGLLLAAVVLALVPSWTAPLTAVAGAWAGTGVLLAWLRGGRPVRSLRWRPLRVMIGAAGLGALLRYVGRTGGALCVPASMLQPHAAWHLLAAIAVVAFAQAAYCIPSRRAPAERPVSV